MMKRCPDTFGELPSTGALPSRDSEIKGAIVRIAKTTVVIIIIIILFEFG